MLVSILIEIWNDDLSAGPTIRSVRNAISRVEDGGAEVIALLDRPAGPTIDIISQGLAGNLSVVEAADCGLCWTRALSVAKGRYVAPVLTGDLWPETWLAASSLAATRDAKSVLHPALRLHSGRRQNPIWCVDSETALFDPRYLHLDDPWGEPVFGPAEVFRAFPRALSREPVARREQVRAWNQSTLSAGHSHRPVPETLYVTASPSGRFLSDHDTQIVDPADP